MKKYESYSRVLPWFMALLLSTLVVACGGGRDPILGSPAVGLSDPVSIAVTPATATVQMGLTQPFVATGTYSNGSTADISTTVAWTSGSPAVATVLSGTGVATGVSAGNATITATSGRMSSSAILTVTAIPVVPPSVDLGSASTFGTFGGSPGMPSS